MISLPFLLSSYALEKQGQPRMRPGPRALLPPWCASARERHRLHLSSWLSSRASPAGLTNFLARTSLVVEHTRTLHKLLSVTEGIRQVTVTPEYFHSLRMAYLELSKELPVGKMVGAAVSACSGVGEGDMDEPTDLPQPVAHVTATEMQHRLP